MKIIYIHQYFHTPKEPGGTRSYWISRALINKGHEVYMITSCNDGEQHVTHKMIDGIHVIYIKNEYKMNFSFFKRLCSFTRFMYLSYREAKKIKEADGVFATSTPLTVGITALALKYFRRLSYVFEVRDLWPEVPIQMGALRNPLLKWVSRKLEKIIYKKANHIIALAPGMLNGVVERGIAEDKVSMIPNMAKIDQFYGRETTNDLYTKYGIDQNKFNVIYFGAMGLSNGLEYIIESAKILEDQGLDTINFTFAGYGSQEEKMKELTQKYGLCNVSFLGNMKMKEISDVVNLCDCSLVTFADLPILRTNSPNKLFDSLSAQKPIIVNSAGWTKDMVEKQKCGAYVDPKNPDELSNLLINWSKDRKLVETMGRNARNLAKNKYDKSILTKNIVSILENSFGR